jgi:hypothetical protein
MSDNAFLRKSSGGIEKFSAGGVDTGASGVNDSGDIVGDYATAKHHIMGYLRAADGSVTEFQDPDAGRGAFEGTFPFAVNNAGVITGQTARGIDTGGFIRNADGSFTNFRIAGTAAPGIYPSAINQSGLIVGHYFDSSQVQHAFVRDPAGNITMVDAPGAETGAYQGAAASSVADDDTIAGYYVDASSASHGFLLKNGALETFDAPGAGTGSGEGTTALGINEKHVIVGYEVDGNGVFHGFLRTP